MVTHPIFTKVLLTTFVLAALFGVYGMVSLSHTNHGGCPASPAQHTLCASPLEHLSHWQAIFTAVFAQVLLLVAFVALFSVRATLSIDTVGQTQWKFRQRVPLRPIVLQELFSQGILHRKEPQHI
jgi:hypothetical protein